MKKVEVHVDADSLRFAVERPDVYNIPEMLLSAAEQLDARDALRAYAELLRQVVFDVVEWNEAYKEPLLGPIALIDRARAALAKNPNGGNAGLHTSAAANGQRGAEYPTHSEFETCNNASMTTQEIRGWLAPATGECRQQIEKLLAHLATLEGRPT